MALGCVSTMKIEEATKKLGLKQLKPKQEKIIKKIVKGKNVISILPTGYGKSACYIISYLMLNKTVVVISPLISLMEDQGRKLKSYGINHLCFNSLNSKDEEFMNKMKQIKKGKETAVLLFSPESFLKQENIIKHLIVKDRLSFITLDESHCLSNWKSFRGSYKELGIIQKWIKNKKIPMLCMTATSTDNMVRELMKILGMDIASLVKESFYKSNLNIFSIHKARIDSDISRMKMYINANKNGCKTIVYCKTRKETETISYKLNKSGILSKHYHANIPPSLRLSVQDEFTNGDLNVIVSTIAFGMGIDIPNINLVIHYGISTDIESYYQEIGRGGRNGQETVCLLMWGQKDFYLNDNFNRNSNRNMNELAIQDKKSDSIKSFVYTRGCRQQFICKYFGEDIDICKKCDNCIKEKKINTLPIISTYLIISTIYKNNIKPTKRSLSNQLKSIPYNELDTLLKILIEKNMLRKINIRTKQGNAQEVFSVSCDGDQWFKRNSLSIQKSLKVISKLVNNKKDSFHMNSMLQYVNRMNY